MSGGENGSCGSTDDDDGNFAAFGTEETSLHALRRTTDSRLLRLKNSNDILREYLLLELGKSKKDIFNFIHLGQSMKISNIKNTSKLLNTVLKYKIINTQFEVDLKLACIDADDSESLPNYLTQEDKKKQGMPIDSLILQSTHLEDSNFKNQFFVTRCSFQFICAHLMQEYASAAYKRTELDVEKQLLVTLTYLGTVLSYKYLHFYLTLHCIQVHI